MTRRLIQSRWLAGAVALVLFALTAGVLLAFIAAFGIDKVERTWSHITPYAQALKWSLMILLVLRWNSLAECLRGRFSFTTEEVAALKQVRWRAAIALLLMELFIGQNLLGRLLA